MLIFLIVILLPIVGSLLFWPWWKMHARAHLREQAEQRRLLLECSQPYQKKRQLDYSEREQLHRHQMEWAKYHHAQLYLPAGITMVGVAGSTQWYTTPGAAGRPMDAAVSPAGQIIEGSLIYPTAPPFAEMQHLISADQFILAYGVNGRIPGGMADLLSMGLSGRPGTGKSVALMYYLAMLLLAGASVHVFDPQGTLNELAGLFPYVGNVKKMDPFIQHIADEVSEREALYEQGVRVFRPMLVLVDELVLIASYEQNNKIKDGLLALAEYIVLYCRKFNIFCMLTGQSLPSTVLPTLTRDNLSSRLVFSQSDAQARMAGLDAETRKKILPLLKRAEAGTAILDVSRRSDPELVAIPYTTVDDVRAILERSQHTQNEPKTTVLADAWASRNLVLVQPENPTGATPDERPTDEVEQTDARRFSGVECEQFIIAFRAAPNIDKALKAIGKGKAYRAHAREIVQAMNLRKEA